ncbi:alpha/beta hydrolase [Kineococcus gypseus]|uniref:alpha/beta hydrolase n=1 Tax=Kineococcus gypseus TaxID=1637102 RepID=UPI003D7CBB90
MSTTPFDVGTPLHDAAGPQRPLLRAGTTALDLAARPALLAVPTAAAAGAAVPLLVFFHGSRGDPQQSLALVGAAAERRGVAVLAPASSDYSWDLVVGAPGPDVAVVRRGLAEVAALLPVDPARLCLGGFSDGASYALTVGLANPAAVEAVTAFSPGFAVDGAGAARPRCFVAHGTADRVLPIERTSRVLVPRLRRAGHEVQDVEFTGGHEVPAAVLERALGWWLGGPPARARG